MMNAAQERIEAVLSTEFGGHLLNTVDGPNGSEIQFWMVNGTTVIAQNFGDDGFEVYCSSGKNKVLHLMNFVKQQVGL